MRKDYPEYPVHRVTDLAELLRFSVYRYGSRPAFERRNETITYEALEQKILAVAQRLEHCHRGFIILQIQDPVLFAIGYFAVVLTGNAAVLMDSQRIPAGALVPQAEQVLTDDIIRDWVAVGKAAAVSFPEQDTDAVCTIVYSSGTTSASKGVMLSQKNLCCNVVSGLEKYRFTDQDRLLQLIPYEHAFGLVCDLLAPLLAGTTICVPDSKAQAMAQMAAFQPTMMNAPPAIAQALLSLAERVGSMETVTGGKLRKLLCGGAGLRAEVTERLLCWDIKALGCYGVSECSPCVSVNRDEYYRAGSAGVPLNCNQIRIAEDGEILVRGENVMLGYYGHPELTAEMIRDGEYHTGDIGYLDEAGFLYVTGRKSNLIVFEDGTKCLPEDLEQQILANPAVREVVVYLERSGGTPRLSARVFAPDPQTWDTVRIYIRSIRSYQPIATVIFETEPLPKTSTGKIRRNYEH